MTILQPSDVSFSAKRMAMPSPSDGIVPSTASVLIREFESCPNCDADLDPDVTDAKAEDRDVVWADRVFGSSYHTCDDCGAKLKILAEEKAFGVIGENQIPDDYDEDVLYFVKVPDSNSVLMVNTFQLMIHVAEANSEEPVDQRKEQTA